MLYENFFSLLSVFIGLSGSIFLVKSVLILNPRAILKLTSPYSRIAYAPEQIKSFAKQKADALVGVLLVFIAFLIQIHSLIFISNENYLLQ